jgi:methionine-rich copper-binding protein CopC
MTRIGNIVRPVLVVALTAAIAGTSLAAAGNGAGTRHVHLVKSEPAANDTVPVAPAAIRLWFSQQPELAITSVKLASASGTAIALAPVARDTGAADPIVATVRGALPSGAYVVTWKTTANDGHPANGTIPFVVMEAR